MRSGGCGSRRRAVPAEPHPVRTAVGHVVAVSLVWAALVAPDSLPRTGPRRAAAHPARGAGARRPGAAAAGPARAAAGRPGRGGAGTAHRAPGRSTSGFFVALNRPFDPLIDWGYADVARSGCSATRSAAPTADVVLVGVLLLTVVVLVGMPAALLAGDRAGPPAPPVRPPAPSSRSRVVWVLSAVVGLQALHGTPVASHQHRRLAYDRVGAGPRTRFRDQREFTAALTDDPLRDRARRRAADRTARARTCWSSSSRATAGWRSRTRSSVGHVRRRRSTRDPRRWRRPASAPAAPSSPPRRSAGSAGWRTPPCSPACGWTTSSGTTRC